jgi:hypothetical protein
MSKPRKTQSGNKGVRLATGPETWHARIEALLAKGKAKQYLKNAPGAEAETLAMRAYVARIAALQASGMHREAQALGALVRERFPAHQARRH